MKTKNGQTKVYITENGHTRTVDISEISDVPVKGARHHGRILQRAQRSF